MTHPFHLGALLLAPAYGFADRFAGGGWPALDAKLPGRAAFWGALLAAAIGFWSLGPPGAAFALVWLAWRTPAWKLFPGSSATPHGTKEIAATFARHAIPIVGAFIVCKAFALPLLPALPAFVGFASVATALAAWYGGEVADARQHADDVAVLNMDLEAHGRDPLDVAAEVIDTSMSVPKLTGKALKLALRSLPRKSGGVIADPEANAALAKALQDPDEMTRLLNMLEVYKARRSVPMKALPSAAGGYAGALAAEPR